MDNLTLFFIGSAVGIIALTGLVAFVLNRTNLSSKTKKIIFSLLCAFIVMPVLMPVPNFVILPVPHIIFVIAALMTNMPELSTLPVWYVKTWAFNLPSFAMFAGIFWIIGTFIFKKNLAKSPE